MKKSLLFLAAICCAMMISAAPAHRIAPQKLPQKTVTVCQLDSMYYYAEGYLVEKDYYTEFNQAGYVTAVTYFYFEEGDSNWYENRIKYEYNERNQQTKATWYWYNGTEWTSYWEEEYTYDANGVQTGYAYYSVDNNVRTGNECKGTVVNGDTTSYVSYNWNGTDWAVSYKTDTVRANGVKTVIAYRPGPTGPMPMSKTEYTEDNDGTYTVSNYRYNDEWSFSDKQVSNKQLNPDSTLSYSMQGADLVLKSKNVYTYNEAGQILTCTFSQLDVMSGQMALNRVETYVYDANGNETSYTSEGYMGGAISFGNKRVSTYDANGNLTEVLNLGYDAINSTFTQNQGKMVYEYDENGNMTLFTNYSYNDENGFYVTNQEEYEFDEMGNLISEKYSRLDWMTYVVNEAERFEYFFTCTDIDDALENIESTNTSVKVIVDGQLYIIRDNVVYNMQGQIVK